jgi:hypothetical protein
MNFPVQLPYILTTSDIFLTPIYIILLFFIVKRLKKKYYSHSLLQGFILPAFFIHVAGTIFFALLMQFYYGYGDTYGYFTGAHETWVAFLKDPRIAFELIFKARENFSQAAVDLAPYSSFTGFAQSLSSVIKIASVASLFCFGSYLPIALIFSSFSFLGSWLIYVTIYKYFPDLYKITGIACLFIPSMIIWSSGISKEPPSMFALGLCFYSFDKILCRERLLTNLTFLLIGAIILYNIKSYILFTFALAALVWGYRYFIIHINNSFFKLIIRLFCFLLVLGFLIYVVTVPDNSIQQTVVTNFASGENLQELMTSINDKEGGSGYKLPPFTSSIGGLIESFFLSLNVTLFRPYIWECSNVLMVMSSAESFGTLLLVLVTLFKAGIKKTLHYCQLPIMLFMLVFSLILAPIVGFISFNFGTLARYKIPLLPFIFLFFAIILFDKNGTAGKAKTSAN